MLAAVPAWAAALGPGAEAAAAQEAGAEQAALPVPSADPVAFWYEQALHALAREQWVLAQELLEHVLLLQPRHAGAALDLALLLCARSSAAQAQQWWLQAQTTLQLPPALHQALLAQVQACVPLAGGVAGVAGPSAAAGGYAGAGGGAAALGIGGSGGSGGSAEAHARAEPSGLLELELGLGLSDNANLGVRDVLLELPTAQGPLQLRLLPQYGAQAAATGLWRLEWQQALGGSGWHGLVQWQGQWPQGLPQQQVQGLRLVLQRPWQAQGWSGVWLGQWGGWELGGRTHQHDWSAAALVQWPAPALPAGWVLRTGASVGAQRLQPPLGFGIERLQGWVELGQAWGQGGYWHLQATRLHEGAQGPRPGGDVQGWHLSARAEHALGTWVQRPLLAQAQAEWAQRSSALVFAPGLIDAPRQQRWQLLQVGLRWQSSPAQSWSLHWQWVDNAENIPFLAYRAQSLELRWLYRWQPARAPWQQVR